MSKSKDMAYRYKYKEKRKRESMKFIHIADIHFDSPFVNLSDRENLGDIKRLEQRSVFKKVIEYIKENDIEFLFIAGDVYEHQYIRKSTIEYINKLFKEIPNTKIYISPGNHDPFIKNSYYNQFKWNDNVHIFSSKMEKIELKDVDIYGYGFDDFYCTDCGIENLEIENKTKTNVLVIHSTVDGANLEEKQYNSISKKLLEEKGFDYVATGHIHKLDYNTYENQKIVYPGSLISLGFDELGKHGMIVGEIKENKELSTEFVPLSENDFEEIELDVTNIISRDELIEKINDLEIANNQLVKIILIGKRNFEIDKYELYKLLTNERIIKVKDHTKIQYDLEKMANTHTLKGLFVKEILLLSHWNRREVLIFFQLIEKIKKVVIKSENTKIKDKCLWKIKR